MCSCSLRPMIQLLRTARWWRLASLSLMRKGAEGKMRRTILLVAAMVAALLMAGSVVLLSGLGRDDPPVAQAQTTSEGQDDSARQDSSRAKGGAGRAVERGVSMRPETDGSQAQAVPRRAVEFPAPGPTERGKAALREA